MLDGVGLISLRWQLARAAGPVCSFLLVCSDFDLAVWGAPFPLLTPQAHWAKFKESRLDRADFGWGRAPLWDNTET